MKKKSLYKENFSHTQSVGGIVTQKPWANNISLAKLVKDHGTQVKSFNDDVWDAFGEAAKEVFEETRAHSAMTKKVDDAYQSFMRECGTMMANFEVNYTNQRNRVLNIS